MSLITMVRKLAGWAMISNAGTWGDAVPSETVAPAECTGVGLSHQVRHVNASAGTVVPRGYTAEEWADREQELRRRSFSADDYLELRREWLVGNWR